MKNQTLLCEKVINSSSTRLWQALTNINDLRQWSMPFPEFIPIRGFQFSFELGPPGAKVYSPSCKILEVVRGRKLAFSWRDSVVTYRLTPMGSQTLVQISHEGIETFPDEFDREDFHKGWNYTIDALQKFAEPELINQKS